jgi:predicted ATPase/DNA-binding SARP family transcriptional activator
MSERLALYLLGPPRLELDHAAVSIDRRKTLALLTYLAVNRWQHHRDHVSALLWPDYDQAKAFTNLRHILWEVQQAIGEGWILAGRDTVGLIPDAEPSSSSTGSGRAVWLDVARFQSLIAESRAQKEVTLRLPLLMDSVKLYRDQFLTGFTLKYSPNFNEWAVAQTEDLSRQFSNALTMLAEDLYSLGQANTAIPYAQRLVVLDPLNETSHRQLMQIYVQAGQNSAALKQYQVCEQILRKELGVDPQPETRALYRQIRKGGIKPTQPVRPTGVGAPQHNLPLQLSTFIGREKELGEIADLIASRRLVTLTGSGGIGKTRLSLKVGQGLLNDYADGVWLVELASLNDARRVAQTMAALFGIVEGSQESPTEGLIRTLRLKSMLLILDNCEHLLDACARLTDTLLKHCPNLKILATSREALGITGEALYHVTSLGLPDLQQILDEVFEYESIQLFGERARLIQTDFSLTIGNVSSVAQICHRLDGIPLAIELAAARVNLLSTEQIAARLNESFNLLTGGSRTTLPRHQTLRASIDWSWNLLSESERSLLRRLSVFAGSWTLEGAEYVGGGNGVNESDVLDLLNNLVEKSLVLRISGNDRYRMLETVRVYAFEQLKDSKEEESTRDRHLDFYVAMAERAESKLFGREQGLWMQKLGEEQENLIAANDWCARSKARTERRFQLLGGTRYYWLYAGLSNLGFRIFTEALAIDTDGQNTLAQGLTHQGAGIFGQMLQDPSTLEHIEKSILIFQGQGNYVEMAVAIGRKALWHAESGNHAEAIRIYQDAIALSRQTTDRRPLSAALNNLAELYRTNEEYEKATPLYEESLGIDRERDDLTGVVLGLSNLAGNKLMQGKLDDVRSQLAEAARLGDEAYLREYMQFVLRGTAVLQFMLGQHLEGARLFGAAAAELRRKEAKLESAEEKFAEYWTTKIRETLGEESFAEAMAEGGKLPYEGVVAETRKWLEEGHA